MSARHYEDSRWIAAAPRDVFAFIDDHARFSSHMSESSWMMGGSRMQVELDDAKGHGVGSHIRLSGRVFGIRLFVDEVVTKREPPRIKVWETAGTPKLLVIGAYTMGVHVIPDGGGSELRVFIDYDFPKGWPMSWLGRLCGGVYARWCVTQMVGDTSKHFRSHVAAAA